MVNNECLVSCTEDLFDSIAQAATAQRINVFTLVTMLFLQVSVLTTMECWFSEQQTFHGPSTLPSGDGICYCPGESCPQFSTCVDWTLLTLPQI